MQVVLLQYNMHNNRGWTSKAVGKAYNIFSSPHVTNENHNVYLIDIEHITNTDLNWIQFGSIIATAQFPVCGSVFGTPEMHQ
jgi:hypothetical protein